MRKFSVGRRRTEFVRAGKAMDGVKRAGMTALGRAASNASKRGFANRRFSFMAVFVITSLVAAHVQTADKMCRATRRKLRGPTPKAKTLNVKVLSHDKALTANDFSCNRGNPDEVRAAGGIERGAWGWNGERNCGASLVARDGND